MATTRRTVLINTSPFDAALMLRRKMDREQLAGEALLKLGALGIEFERMGLRYAYRPPSFSYIRWCSDDPSASYRVGEWFSLSAEDLRDNKPLTAMATRGLYEGFRDVFDWHGITAEPSSTQLGARAAGDVEDGDAYLLTFPCVTAVSINPDIKAAIADVLKDADQMERLGLLAEQMKPEGAFRDAVFVALRRRGVVCDIEARAGSGTARTDLVILNEAGVREAVEFKFWLAPNILQPKKVAKGARKDWEKHGGDATIVTIFSNVRSVKYFRGCPDERWTLDASRELVADVIGAQDHWQARNERWLVDVAR